MFIKIVNMCVQFISHSSQFIINIVTRNSVTNDYNGLGTYLGNIVVRIPISYFYF